MSKAIVRRAFSVLAEQHFPSFHPVLSRVFSARGIVEEIRLQYQLKRLLPPELKGMERAVDLLLDCVVSGHRLLVLGDFDVDGATSTALAVRCLTAFGLPNVEFLVPNRFEYGYGLTPEIVAVAALRKPNLILTVDNGISSVDGVKSAQSLGMRVVITDHHLPGDRLPDADAIINPNQPGCAFASKAAAGVGVIFYLMTCLRTRLREIGWFNEQRVEPNLAGILDLVALGTVADVVPLDDNNRIFVAQGLQRIRAGKACVGINALLQVGGKDLLRVQATDLGFIVGPRLNAAGRLDDMSLGIRCLLTDDAGEALAIAYELDALNRERRSIEGSMQHEAIQILAQMQKDPSAQMPLGVCFYQDDWHQGVIGILASRMKDRLHRPVIVFADDGDGQLKGSGRSIPGVHLRDVLDYVAKRQPGMLEKFGGHAMAAGMTLKKADLPRFKVAFADAIEHFVQGDTLQPKVETDGELRSDDFALALAEQIEKSGPWGQGFPEPSFDGEFILQQQKIVGSKHLKMLLSPVAEPSAIIDAIAFNVDLQLWPNPQCGRVQLVYKLAINEYRGARTLQLIVDYLMPSDSVHSL